MNRRLLFLTAALSLTTSVMVYAAPRYHVLPITAGEGNGINCRGDVVGQTAIYGNAYQGITGGHAFLYKNGTLTDLGIYYTPLDPVYETTEGMALNSADVVVGAIANYGGPLGGIKEGYFDAFIWKHGKFTDIAHGTTDGGESCYSTAINERGEVCGVFDALQYYNIYYGNSHGFLYRNGTMTDLRPLDNSNVWGSNSYAYDVNNAGQVVGGSYDPVNGSRGVQWTNGKAHVIGRTSFVPSAINDNGWIAGRDSSGAVLYIYGLTITLGKGDAISLNNSGVVVGNVGASPGSASTGAFVYLGKMYDLNTLVDGGWKITEVGQINDAGQIAATGILANNPTVTFALLLTPVGRRW